MSAAGDLFLTASSSNFILNLLISGSMQQLFGMIRAMQLIIFTVLIRTPMNGFAFEFFRNCMFFAQADVFDGASLYQQWFVFNPTPPLNSNVASLGIDHSTYFLNSGSFFIIMAQIFCVTLFKISFNLFARCCWRK